jgi:hypothetical protein
MRSTLLAAALAAPFALAASAVAATQETAPAADSFDGLRAEFDQLSRYLMSRRGIGTAERQELLSLRRQLDAYAAANPDDARPTVLDLQISLWLGEDDRVDAAFATILDRSPDNTAIRRRWAQARGQANRWDAALEVLSDPSLAGMPEAMLDQARMLMNLNRFAEALAVLEQLPSDGEGAATVADASPWTYSASHAAVIALSNAATCPTSTPGAPHCDPIGMYTWQCVAPSATTPNLGAEAAASPYASNPSSPPMPSSLPAIISRGTASVPARASNCSVPYAKSPVVGASATCEVTVAAAADDDDNRISRSCVSFCILIILY